VCSPDGREGTSVTHPPYLLVIRSDEVDIFRAFKERLEAPDLAQVIWDRRTGERRTRNQPVVHDRRRSERCVPPPTTWTTFGFVVARQARPD